MIGKVRKSLVHQSGSIACGHQRGPAKSPHRGLTALSDHLYAIVSSGTRMSTYFADIPDSAPDGLGALLGGWMPPNVRSGVQLSSTYIRRVLYLPLHGKASSEYIKLERPMPGPTELARTSEEMASDRWTAVQGKRALADVFVPDA